MTQNLRVYAGKPLPDSGVLLHAFRKMFARNENEETGQNTKHCGNNKLTAASGILNLDLMVVADAHENNE